MDNPASSRDGNGRFAAGNPGGPGRSKGRGYELQHAAQDAVSVEEVRALVRKALLLGLQGNLQAMRFVMERTCGKPPESQAAPPDISLPNLRDAAACGVAIDKLVSAVTEGVVDLPTAKALSDMVQLRLKAIEVIDVGQRIADLEKALESVDLGNGRSMRRI